MLNAWAAAGSRCMLTIHCRYFSEPWSLVALPPVLSLTDGLYDALLNCLSHLDTPFLTGMNYSLPAKFYLAPEFMPNSLIFESSDGLLNPFRVSLPDKLPVHYVFGPTELTQPFGFRLNLSTHFLC